MTAPSALSDRADPGDTAGDIDERLRPLGAAPLRVGASRRARLVDGLGDLAHIVEDAYRRLAERAASGGDVPTGGEWLLDNYYVVERAFRVVRDQLRAGFERRLRCFVLDDVGGRPLAYALARELATADHCRIDEASAVRLLAGFQRHRPLIMAEVWAFPLLLRLVLLEELAGAAPALDLPAEAERGTAPIGDLSGGRALRASADETIASCVRSLCTIETTDWKAFFEKVSLTERILRDDPSRIYARMDFETRDRYRKVVEALAAYGDRSEDEVAREAVRRAADSPPGRTAHVGYHLVDAGFETLARSVGYRPVWTTRWRARRLRRPSAPYLGAIAAVTLAHEGCLAAALLALGASPALATLGVVLGVVPALTIAVSLVNGVVTQLLPPRVLPKMDFSKGLPPDCRTVVVVPAIVASREDVPALLSRLEIHWLANADPNLQIALLGDFADAPRQSMPHDDDLVRAASDGIRELNARYGTADAGPFHLLHRERQWNAAEGCWMGWERKRGKLVELSRLLVDDRTTSYTVHVGAPEALRSVRFVITLDADTELPREAAGRLAATLAHPLNCAEFDAATGRVTAGYTILQPRVQVAPASVEASWFARLFAGDLGVDLYSRAVSDVYQDLFGQGIYMGKGIYDPVAFERSLRGRVPDNALLSHDLFEGIHGRAGLVTDVVLLEDFPRDYLTYARRLHRWARGDWQLLPWLGRYVPLAGGERGRTRLSAIACWMILDNLRRTVLAPALLGFLLVAWLWLPGSPGLWTVIALLVPAAPALTQAVGGVLAARFSKVPASAFARAAHTVRLAAALWALHIVFLAHRAALLGGAVARTLLRVYVGRRHLMQWRSAAAVEHELAARSSRRFVWRQMAAAPVVALASILLVVGCHPAALCAALPLALLWSLAPEVAFATSRRRSRRLRELTAFEVRRLRLLARRTWLFFETFVGPDDQWLPPDHFQEAPRADVAQRTSPTNVALLEIATLAAFDFGWAGGVSVALRLRNTVDTLERMERHRGHFYNWYDTRDLAPLPPRYVSTVDSGNLAAALLAVEQGCHDLAVAPIMRSADWSGLVDTLGVLAEVIERASTGRRQAAFTRLAACVHAIEARASTLRERPADWAGGIDELLRHGCAQLEHALVAAIEGGAEELASDLLAELRIWAAQVRHHVAAMHRDSERSLPWLSVISRPPDLLAGREHGPGLADAWSDLRDRLRPDCPLAELPAACAAGTELVERLRRALASVPAEAGELAEARAWVGALADGIARSRDAAQHLLEALVELGARAGRLVREMDFGLLYDEARRIFYIGCNVTADTIDEHHYDLLASEARMASFVAIAKGDVPQEHWLHLGRPIADTPGGRVLLSWSATMFEYLMPSLLLREGEDTLLGQACRAAVRAQIAHAKRHGVPWGISESGYFRLDAQQNYQYRAFGIPELGFKRDLEDELVVAPYASILAARLAPDAVLHNLDRLERLGLSGRYGLYEAVDFTRSRLPRGATHALVRSFMAHHQGMILAALDNLLNGDPLVRRFHAAPLVQTAELLLFERPAPGAPVERPRPAVAARPAPPAERQRLQSWQVPTDAAFPQAHVLSNGRYGAVVTAAHGGWSEWGTVALTRWHADTTRDDAGVRVYLRDLDSGAVWMPLQGAAATTAGHPVLFHPHMVEYHHRASDVSIRERVCVAPETDMEIRLFTLSNAGLSPRHLEVTTYAEVVLGDPAEDRRHPAFSKLFVESEYLDDLHALLLHRRPRAPGDEPAWLLHMMVGESGARATRYESARERFVGRGRTVCSPAMLIEGDGRGRGATGPVLDPVVALSVELDLPPRHATRVASVLVAAPSREAAIAEAARQRSPEELEWMFELARRSSAMELATVGLGSDDLPAAQRLLSLVLHPYHGLRAAPAVLAANQLGQASLWKHAISGDLPILVLRLQDPEESPLLDKLLRVQAFWRGRGIRADLVILNERATGYGAELDDRIVRVIGRTGHEAWLQRPGGIFPIRADQIGASERTLLLAAGRAVLDGSGGTLEEQVGRLPEEPARLPPLVPTRSTEPGAESLPSPGDLLFDNGYGGFSPDGREYVIHLRSGQSTPAPWVNVVANPGFGFVVSESGGGYTWAENSGENRLTPWRNDPVSDEPGEVVYLRDEETGAVWSPTPAPSRGPGAYEIRHGAGYTTFRHRSHGLDQILRLFTPVDAPVKILALVLTNRLDRPRRLTATFYAEWVLGASREMGQQFVVPEFDAESQTLLACNPWNEAFRGRVAFVAASGALHGLTGSRSEFLGERGGYEAPAALARIGLASTVRAGLDPCAALQVHVDLAPGATADLHFLLGQGRGRDDAIALARKYRDGAAVQAAWTDLGRQWDELLGAVTVHTPEPGLDVMLNRWLLYQTVASRLWGRTGYHQSSGAFGFRDQLQDVMALVHAAPAMCRSHLLEAAGRQFEQGDVLHWWHPPTGAGVRTRCSDDLLWLPYVTAHYVAATGDTSVLAERMPHLSADQLRPDEVERYGQFAAAGHDGTLYEHCLAAIERAHTKGPHGLPLIGTGDWNDGMNRVGAEGRGESVWLGWFLYATLVRFSSVSELAGEPECASVLRQRAEQLRRTIEASGWDGGWYRRGYYDDGRPLGSAASEYGRIDSIAQSWAVLSSGGDPERASAAMAAVCRHLVRETDGLVLLLAPPFESTGEDPGYIRGYPPGVRENGGQYTDAAIWVLWALAALGDGDRAVELLRRLLPVHRCSTPEAAARYRVEPYVLAADVYSVPPHDGRGGWTWYTGAAAWAYRLGLEAILGIRLEGGRWRVDPCIPRGWPGFDVTLRDGSTVYRIRVDNPGRTNRGVDLVLFDGEPVEAACLPRPRDGQVHQVAVRMRSRSGHRSGSGSGAESGRPATTH